MKLASPKYFIAIASAALVLAGCSKKPTRPDPSQTVLGQAGVGGGAAPTTIDTGIPPGTDLTPRDAGDWLNGQNRELLKAQSVYFDFDRADVKPSEREKLKAAKDYLDKNPGDRLLLEGHCDWRGTAEYNLGLGDRRANAVKKYLQSIGVAADKLESLSKGSLEAKKEGGDAQWKLDRRVDLVVVRGPGGAATPAGAPAAPTGKLPGAE